MERSELKNLESNINEVLYFCEVTKKSKLDTIAILEVLFNHHRIDNVDAFFEWDYYQRYMTKLESVRNCNGSWKIYWDTETLFI